MRQVWLGPSYIQSLNNFTLKIIYYGKEYFSMPHLWNDISELIFNWFQGFLCPMCMKAFPDPDVLQNHFDKEHGDNPEPPDQVFPPQQASVSN